MNHTPRDIDLEKRIDAYVKGHLTEKEADRLWIELLKKPAYLDLLETELHVKSIIERQTKQKQEAMPAPGVFAGRLWKWTAAAVFAAMLVTALYLLQGGKGGAGQSLALPGINRAEHLASPDIVRAQMPRLSEADSLLIAGFKAAISGRFDEALSLYNQVIARDDNDHAVTQAYFNIGIIRYNAGRFKGASAAFNSALQEAEENSVLKEKAYWFLGHTFIHLNEFEEAREAVRNTYVMDGIYREQASGLLQKLEQKATNTDPNNIP